MQSHRRQRQYHCMHIAIVSASVRTGRKSHRVARYFERYIQENNLATVEIIDLHAYNFPVFEERLQYLPEPPAGAVDFGKRIDAAQGVIIVTPEYNGGYPASLKNAIDLLHPQWVRKPVALATVSSGPFGGAQVTTSLLFTLWKIGAWMVPAMFPVSQVQDHYDEHGVPKDKEATDKRAKRFVGELLWCMEAGARMNA